MKVKKLWLIAIPILLIIPFIMGVGEVPHYNFADFIEIYPPQGQHYLYHAIEPGPTNCDVDACLSWTNGTSTSTDTEFARGYISPGQICNLYINENNCTGQSGELSSQAPNVDFSGNPAMNVFHGCYPQGDPMFFQTIRYGVVADGIIWIPDND